VGVWARSGSPAEGLGNVTGSQYGSVVRVGC
jgi:hypothetical protein